MSIERVGEGPVCEHNDWFGSLCRSTPTRSASEAAASAGNIPRLRVGLLDIHPRNNTLATSPRNLGLCTVVALVLLRLGVGWHFFKEGSEKVQSGKFSSAGFLGSAKGPLAGFFKSMLRDPEGHARLDREATLKAWNLYRERVARHYGFDEAQEAKAEKIYSRYEDQLEYFFNEQEEGIDVYFKSLKSKAQDQADPVRQGVSSLKNQIGKKAVADTPPEPGPWFAKLEGMWKAYEQDLNELATEDQQRRRTLKLARPGATTFGAEQVDKVLPYFDLLVGVCLILGLFTRTASVAASIFLCSVIATQWPGSADAAPTYPQVIEMLSLLVLAATGAGRFAGLDFFISTYCCKCCSRKQEKRNESKA